VQAISTGACQDKATSIIARGTCHRRMTLLKKRRKKLYSKGFVQAFLTGACQDKATPIFARGACRRRMANQTTFLEWIYNNRYKTKKEQVKLVP